MSERIAMRKIQSLSRRHKLSKEQVVQVLEMKGEGIPISFSEYKNAKAKGVPLKKLIEDKKNIDKKKEHLQFSKDGLTVPTINWMDIALVGLAAYVFYQYIYKGATSMEHGGQPTVAPAPAPAPAQVVPPPVV